MNERTNLLYGDKIVQSFSSATVLVVGVGGVGGMAVEALARSGIGKLILVDYDKVSNSNLNRQIISLTSTIGMDKVTCFQNRIKEINKDCEVIAKKMKLTLENSDTLFQEKIDFILDACDDKEAKIALRKKAEEKQIPHLMALGAGNRKDSSQVVVTTLEKTKGDPLARKMRTLFRKNQLSLKTKVVYSEELPMSPHQNTIASSIFVPATVGLRAANYIIDYLSTKKEV